jgi:hypothetical protein
MADTLNFQIAKEGFGSYLSGILPDNIAVTAGAFSATMQQIKNIRSIDFENFSQVVFNIETTKGLNQVNGTTIPTNTTLATAASTLISLGSGPYGTYTMSDFLGCMSGLPYAWQEIQSLIQSLQTTTLINIYKNLYLAVTWEIGTVSVQYTDDGLGNYTVTGITLTDPGGGYGREGAASPSITLSNGGTGSTTIGTNPDDLSTYGRITSITLTSPGSVTGTIPTGTVANPPTTYGSAGWPGMNTAVQYYIDAANTEITSIKTANPVVSSDLNTIYKAVGTQLTLEQRARYTGISPVPSPTRDTRLNSYPTSQYVFVDSIPTIATSTLPHMYAQTLEAISDLNTVGGQSIVAMMRQERNAARLQEIGIELDNSISNELDQQEVAILIANGTLPTGVEGITVTGINGDADNPNTTFTLPSNFIAQPIGYYDPNIPEFKLATNPCECDSPIQQILNTARNNINNTNILGPAGNGTGPAQPNISAISPISTGISKPSVNPRPGLVSAILEAGPAGLEPIAIISACSNSPGISLDTGGPAVPGSLAGSPVSNIIPPNLNSALTAAVLSPSVYNVADAIEEVIKCNCDCWID